VQLSKQSAVLAESSTRRPVKVVDRPNVHSFESGTGQLGEVACVADEPLVGRRPFETDHDDGAFRTLNDIVRGQKSRRRIGNCVIEPELCQLLQGGEVRKTEVVRQRCIHPLFGKDETLRQPTAERRGRKIDEHRLAGSQEGIRHGFGRVYPGDPGDEPAQRFATTVSTPERR
jgi:hypothetical protein